MAAPLNAIIIDDEPLARQELLYLLENAGDVHILAQGTNGIEAVDLIRTHAPDIVFLDVQMPGLDGFAVIKKLLDTATRLPQVVFATAFDQYAVRAFEVNAVDYLLKPFDRARVSKTIEKARARLAATAEATPFAPLPDTGPFLTHEAIQTQFQTQSEAKLDALLKLLAQQAEANTQALTHAARPITGKVVVRTQNRLLLVDQREICFASIDEGAITVVTSTVEGQSKTEVPVSRNQTKRLRELFNL